MDQGESPEAAFPPVIDPVDKAMKLLVEDMGFDISAAKKALLACDDGEKLDVERAIAVLTSDAGCPPKVERAPKGRERVELPIPCAEGPSPVRRDPWLGVSAGKSIVADHAGMAAKIVPDGASPGRRVASESEGWRRARMRSKPDTVVDFYAQEGGWDGGRMKELPSPPRDEIRRESQILRESKMKSYRVWSMGMGMAAVGKSAGQSLRPRRRTTMAY